MKVWVIMKGAFKKRVVSPVIVLLVFALAAPAALARYTLIGSCGAGAYKAQGKLAFDADCSGDMNLVNLVSITIIVQYYNTSTGKWINVDEYGPVETYANYGDALYLYTPPVSGDYSGKCLIIAY